MRRGGADISTQEIRWIAGGAAASGVAAYASVAYPPLTAMVFMAIAVTAFVLLTPRVVVLPAVMSVVFVAAVLLRVMPLTGFQLFASSLALAACVLVAYLRSPRGGQVPHVAAWWMAGLTAIVALATFASPTPDWFYGGVALVGVVFAFCGSRLDTRGRGAVELVIVVASCFLAAAAIVETFLLESLLWFSARGGQSAHALIPGGVRAEATLGHPLVLGFVLLIALLLLLTRFEGVGRILPAALLCAGIVATGSASVVLVGILVGAYSLWRRWAGFWRLVALLVALTAAVALILGGVLPVGLLDEVTGSNASHRAASVSAIPSLLTERSAVQVLIGSGWGANAELYSSGIIQASGSNAIDNQWVTALAHGGVLGCTALLWFAYASLRRARFSYRPALLASFVMFFSFDLLTWLMPAILIGFLVSGEVAPTTKRPRLEPHARRGSDRERQPGRRTGTVQANSPTARPTVQ